MRIAGGKGIPEFAPTAWHDLQTEEAMGLLYWDDMGHQRRISSDVGGDKPEMSNLGHVTMRPSSRALAA